MAVKVTTSGNLVNQIKVRDGGVVRNVSLGRVMVSGVPRIFFPDGDLEVKTAPIISHSREANDNPNDRRPLTIDNRINPGTATTLTVSNGKWQVGTNEITPTSFIYKWKSNGIDVGSNQNTYNPTSADRNRTITCNVTALYQGKTASSDSFNSILVATAPGIPSITSINRATPNQLTVNWGTVSTGGSTVNEYRVRWRLSGTSTWPLNQQISLGSGTSSFASRSYLIAGLATGTQYDIQVAAANSETVSDWSSTSQATTLAPPVNITPPSINTPVIANTQMTLNGNGSWSTDGLAPITGYNYFWFKSTTSSFTTSTFHSGLQSPNAPDEPLNWVRLSITATNIAGTSNSVNTSPAQIGYPPPVRPTIFNATEPPIRCNQITLTWGTTNYALGYEILYGTNPVNIDNDLGPIVTFAGASTASGTITGLPAGQYYFKIRAYNRVFGSSGSEQKSLYSNRIGPFTVSSTVTPNAPSVSTNCGFLTISWSAVSGATLYSLEKYNANTGAFISRVTHGPSITTVNDTLVTPGVFYYYRLAVTNPCGIGPYSSNSVSRSPLGVPFRGIDHDNDPSTPPILTRPTLSSTLSNTFKAGETIVSTTGTWTNGATYTYEWQWSNNQSTWNTLSSSSSNSRIIPSQLPPGSGNPPSGGQWIRSQVSSSNTCGPSIDSYTSDPTGGSRIRCGDISSIPSRGTLTHCTINISSISRNASGVVTVTTSVNHGGASNNYEVGKNVRIAGVSTSSFNGTYDITAVPTANTFRYQQSSTTVALVNNSGTANTNSQYQFTWGASPGATRHYFQIRRTANDTIVDSGIVAGTSVTSLCLGISAGITWKFRVRGIPDTLYNSNDTANGEFTEITGTGW